ncbi:MAG: PAS domain-containing protein [Verrucomicrobiota bacterium]
MKPDRASSEEPPPESPPRSAGELRQTILELQRARDELVGKTAFFEAKVHSSPDGILVVDGEGRRILQNQRNIELWNVPKEIADDPLDERQLVWGTAQTKNPKVFAAGVAYLYAHPTETGRDEIELKDGRILDRYSSPVLGHDGRNYGRIWTFRDVTAQVRAARQLEENRALLDGVLRNSVDGVIACQAVRDAQGNLEDFRVLLVNPAAERLLGRRLQDLVGRGLLEASPDIILDGLFEAFARIVETGKTLDFEYSAVRADALRWYRIAGVKLGDGLVLNYSDITARKRQEQNLNLQYAVSDVLARASTVEEARAQILQTLGEQLGWDAAGFWMADARAGLLRCDEVWSRHGLDVGEFLTVSRQMTFRPASACRPRLVRRPVRVGVRRRARHQLPALAGGRARRAPRRLRLPADHGQRSRRRD